MKEHLTVLTRKGQITVPAEVRRVLGLRQGDKVAVVVENGHATLSRAGGIVARTAGMCKSDQPTLTAEELREVAERAIAEDVVKRMGT